MAENATAIFNTITQKVCMLVVDASDLNDPAWNPPDCIQIPLDVDVYNSLTTPEEVNDWVYSVVQGLG